MKLGEGKREGAQNRMEEKKEFRKFKYVGQMRRNTASYWPLLATTKKQSEEKEMSDNQLYYYFWFYCY